MTTTSADTSFEFDANLPSTSAASSTLGAQSMSNGTRQPFPSSSIELSDDEETEDVVADNEYWTPSELLRELTRTYLDESASPKLLPEKLDLVDKLRQQTNEIERIMARNSNKKSLAFSTHKLELYRIEFLVNSYLRTRLKKIEQSPAKALHEHAERLRRALTALRAGKPPDQHPELLDGRELQFAEDLQKANSAFFADSFLKHLPSSLQWLPVPWGPSADQSRVFVEVLKDGLEDVPVPNMADPNSEMLVSLEKGSRHMLPFNCIQHFLERGDVRLL